MDFLAPGGTVVDLSGRGLVRAFAALYPLGRRFGTRCSASGGARDVERRGRNGKVCAHDFGECGDMSGVARRRHRAFVDVCGRNGGEREALTVHLR